MGYFQQSFTASRLREPLPYGGTICNPATSHDNSLVDLYARVLAPFFPATWNFAEIPYGNATLLEKNPNLTPGQFSPQIAPFVARSHIEFYDIFEI